MGLTIHYSLRLRGSDARVRKLINTLHQAGRDLPIQELGEVVDLSGEQCNSDRVDQNDPLRWLLIQAEERVELASQRRVCGGRTYRAWRRIQPIRIMAFSAWPGEGCEASNFGLCQYPAVVSTPEGPLKTRLSGWRWSSFCKTQYASDPQCGGVPHFLKCHLTVIAMLDQAKQLGCLERVSDEGGFWEHRDLAALVQQVGSWNEMMAALAGKLKDALGDGPIGVQSSISHYPNFEQLEAVGQNRLPPGYEQLVSLILRVGAGQPDRPDVGESKAGEQAPSREPLP